jgi:uracil-DNA glycosylase
MNFSVDINPNVPDLCPAKDQMFRALTLTPLEKVKVVIIGQDPYHGENQANGLAFSVNPNIQLPASLKNIFKELKDDLGIENTNGDLTSWANQGVLLLNVVLTTLKGQPKAHFGKGWEEYTDTIIKQVNDTRENIIFCLWGEKSREKLPLIDSNNGHIILSAGHPSPINTSNPFFGCKHFSKINDILKIHGSDPIDWQT